MIGSGLIAMPTAKPSTSLMPVAMLSIVIDFAFGVVAQIE